MKKLLLIISLITTCNLFSYSQVLTNTTWSVYTAPNVFFLYFHFNGDTLSYSTNNITYSIVSKYQENGNNFTIEDITGSCPDTGRYTFAIQSDTLDFTLVNDPCTGDNRPQVMADYIWVRLTTDVAQNTTLSTQVSVYPNPFSFETTINFNQHQDNILIRITDLAGKELRTETFSGHRYTLEKGNLSSGIYFVQIEDGKNNAEIKKIVIQ